MLSHVRLSAAPWTVARQAPLSMEFFRQEYWSEWPFPTPGDLPNPGIEPSLPASPALAGGFFTTVPPRNPQTAIKRKKKKVGNGFLHGRSRKSSVFYLCQFSQTVQSLSPVQLFATP